MTTRLIATLALWDRLFHLVVEWQDNPTSFFCKKGCGCLRPKGHKDRCFPEVKPRAVR